jgi:hypothetical protein
MTYPMACCHDQDCAPVEKTETVAPFVYAGAATGNQTPALWVTTKHGRAMVPPDMERRQSQDHRPHACIRAGKVVCYFLPPQI